MTTLLMIPGLGSDGAVWNRTIFELDNVVNWQVGDTLTDDTLHGMAQHILDAAPQRFALAGVSMGGMVALEIMKMAPERLTRLALVDTNARPDTLSQKAKRHLFNWIVALNKDFRRLSEYSLRTLVPPSTSSEIRAEIVEMGVRVGAKAYIRQNRAVLAREDLRSILRSIAVPTAVVVGAEDRMTPLEMSREIHTLIPASTLQIIPACGHLPPIEKPQAMAKILLELMRHG